MFFKNCVTGVFAFRILLLVIKPIVNDLCNLKGAEQDIKYISEVFFTFFTEFNWQLFCVHTFALDSTAPLFTNDNDLRGAPSHNLMEVEVEEAAWKSNNSKSLVPNNCLKIIVKERQAKNA